MSNRRYRSRPKRWVVLVLLPLSKQSAIRYGRFETHGEARVALSRVLRGYLQDRRERPDEVPMLNRVHVKGTEETHLYFAAGGQMFPAFMVTKVTDEEEGPLSIFTDRLGGLDELAKRGNKLIASWVRAMVLLEQKHKGRKAYVTRGRKRRRK